MMAISRVKCDKTIVVLIVARERFELSSAGPKPAMLVHYTTGLHAQNVFELTL